MYTKRATMALTIIAITMAIALVTAGSLNASVLAARSSKSSRGGGGSVGTLGGPTLGGTATSSRSSAGASPRALMSDFVKCLRSAGTSSSSLGATSGASSGGAGMLTRADVTNCYDSVYRGAIGGGAGGSLGSTGGAGGGTSPSGSLGSTGGAGGGTSPSG
ncbi:MAG TPA: hypothetical protein VE223_07925 [Nitrososphaeraceae archaeon]|nr:hypothetical protein [Nitrososphaeraceae archaeon]